MDRVSTPPPGAQAAANSSSGAGAETPKGKAPGKTVAAGGAAAAASGAAGGGGAAQKRGTAVPGFSLETVLEASDAWNEAEKRCVSKAFEGICLPNLICTLSRVLIDVFSSQRAVARLCCGRICRRGMKA